MPDKGLIHMGHPRQGYEGLCVCTPWDHDPRVTTDDPEVVTCKPCLRTMGKKTITFERALLVALELANENVLEEKEVVDDAMLEARSEQLEAVDRIHELLEVLKGD